MRKTFLEVMVGGLVMGMVVGCSEGVKQSGDDGVVSSVSKSIILDSYASCDDVVKSMQEALKGDAEKRYEIQSKVCQYDRSVPQTSPNMGEGHTTSFTGTNLQEAGVDEADLRTMYAERAKGLGMAFQDLEKSILQQTPLRKYASHDEIAKAALFLMPPESSEGIFFSVPESPTILRASSTFSLISGLEKNL